MNWEHRYYGSETIKNFLAIGVFAGLYNLHDHDHIPGVLLLVLMAVGVLQTFRSAIKWLTTKGAGK